MMLKTNVFENTRTLCKFVNDNNITKENVQNVFVLNGCICLLYWIEE